MDSEYLTEDWRNAERANPTPRRFEKNLRGAFALQCVLLVEGTPQLAAFIKAHRSGHELPQRDIYAVIIGIHRTLIQVWAHDISPKRVAAFNAHNEVEITGDGRLRIRVRRLLPGPDEWAEFRVIEYRHGKYRNIQGRRLRRRAAAVALAIAR